MTYQFPTDVQKQLTDRLATGQYKNEDEVIRDALQALKRQEDDIAAIKEALDDLESGDRGTPVDAFIAEFRQNRRIPSDP